jgi:hypothetical protein
MKIDGRCQCGEITYEAEVDPNQSYICNCTDCQTLAGSALRWSVTVPEPDFKLLTGKLKPYNKPSESGELLPLLFCPNCGSPLYSIYSIDGARFFNVRVPTARQHAELPPKRQYWKRSAQKWLTRVNQIEGSETE